MKKFVASLALVLCLPLKEEAQEINDRKGDPVKWYANARL